MRTGSTTLLRPFTSASGGALLLAAAALAFVPAALAAAAAPDPSPVPAGAQPDPYQAPTTPAVVVVQPRPAVAPAQAPIVRTPARPARVRHRAAKTTVVTVTTTKAVPPLARPDTHALASRLVAAIEPAPSVSRMLALTVACLVLVSGALIAGAARELAR